MVRAMARATGGDLVQTHNGKLELESYVNEPARLTAVTEKDPKVKK
jgi:hypothetical protein